MSPVRKPGGKTGKLRSAARSLAQKVGRKAHDETQPPAPRSVEAAGTTREAGGKTTAPSKKPEPAKRKATTKTTSAKAATPKKTAAAKTPARKTAAKKATAAKTPAKKPTAKKATARKTTVKKPAGSKKTTQPAKRAGSAPAKTPARKGRPAKFDAKALASIRAQLVTEKGDLERQQAEMEEDSFVGTQSEITGEVGLDEDFADAGTATFDRERDLSIQHNIRDLIDQITRAIDRIDEKAYGICERCGESIDAARLKALPHAGLCLDCKRREERTR